jgi:hypothetical protein
LKQTELRAKTWISNASTKLESRKSSLGLLDTPNKKRKRQGRKITNLLNPEDYLRKKQVFMNNSKLCQNRQKKLSSTTVLELKTPGSALEPNQEVFVEGELYRLTAFWHVKVPCVYDSDSKSFKASVEIRRGARFRFFYIDYQTKENVYVISQQYQSQIDFDGSLLNAFQPASFSLEDATRNLSLSTRAAPCLLEAFSLPQLVIL